MLWVAQSDATCDSPASRAATADEAPRGANSAAHASESSVAVRSECVKSMLVRLKKMYGPEPARSGSMCSTWARRSTPQMRSCTTAPKRIGSAPTRGKKALMAVPRAMWPGSMAEIGCCWGWLVCDW